MTLWFTYSMTEVGTVNTKYLQTIIYCSKILKTLKSDVTRQYILLKY